MYLIKQLGKFFSDFLHVHQHTPDLATARCVGSMRGVDIYQVQCTCACGHQVTEHTNDLSKFVQKSTEFGNKL